MNQVRKTVSVLMMIVAAIVFTACNGTNNKKNAGECKRTKFPRPAAMK